MAISSTMATTTEDDWTMAVKTSPSSIATTGFLRDAKRFSTADESLMPDMADDIMASPMKSTPNPTRTSAHFLMVLFLQPMRVTTPARRKRGA